MLFKDKFFNDMDSCEYCYKEFSNKYNLERHQTSAKSCLRKQEGINVNITVNHYKCMFCDKMLTKKLTLDYHLTICKKREFISITDEIIELKKTDTELNINIDTNTVLKHSEFELENKYMISLDYRPYVRKDVVYIYGFKPCLKFTETDYGILLLKDKNKHFFEFGQSSNIEQRDKSHSCDKNKLNTRLLKCIQFKNGFDSSQAEKQLKKIILDMGLKIDYLTSQETFLATYDELEFIYNKMVESSSIDNNTSDCGIELYKYNKKLNIAKQLLVEKEITIDDFNKIIKLL